MTDKPLNCVGIDAAKQQTGSHDFRGYIIPVSTPVGQALFAAAPKQTLVEKVAEAIAAHERCVRCEGSAVHCRGHLELASLAVIACHAEEMLEALRFAHKHTQELRDAWRRGAISEHDGLGGTRSNRNVDVEVKLRELLAKLEGKP